MLKKRILAAALCLCLVMGLGAPAYAAEEAPERAEVREGTGEVPETEAAGGTKRPEAREDADGPDFYALKAPAPGAMAAPGAPGLGMVIDFGQVGTIFWRVEDQGITEGELGYVLVIGGMGEMPRYMHGSTCPWFKYIGSIKKIVIEEGVTHVETYFGREWPSLRSISIPASVVSMRSWSSNPALTKITVDPDNSVYASADGVLFSKDMSRLIKFPPGRTGAYEIPASVSTIGIMAFCESQLTKVAIPHSVETVERGAFQECRNLRDLVIPDSVTEVDNDAFFCCSGLTSLRLSSRVPVIKDGSISGLSGLSELEFPYGVTTIDTQAAVGCTRLTHVVIPDSVTTIKWLAFSRCVNLPDIYIPSSVKTLEDGAFHSCSGLKDIYYGGSESDWREISGTASWTSDDGKSATISGEWGYPGSTAAIHYNCRREDVPNPCRVYRNGGYEAFDVTVEDCAHKTPSSVYNPQLAHMLIAVSNSVFEEADIRATFASFGFEEEPEVSYSMMDGIMLGYAMAKKRLDDGKTLVLIAGRGSTAAVEWISNLDIRIDPATGQHKGFSDASKALYERAIRFLGTEDLSGAVFVVTGFSRGAAAANSLAARLVDEGAPQEQVYAYTFACPDVGIMSEDKRNSYSCIFNVADAGDLVSWLPGGALTKFGTSYWYSRSGSWEDYDSVKRSFDAHNQAEYLNYLRDERPDSEYRGREAADYANLRASLKRNRPHSIGGRRVHMRSHCPVDLEIYSASGQLAGSVTGGNVSASGQVFIRVSGTEKDIIFLDEGEYTVRLSGTGSGVMTYAVRNLDTDTWTAGDEKVFENVALTEGKQLAGRVRVENGEADMKAVTLYVLDSGGSPEKEVLPDGRGTEVPLTLLTLDASGGLRGTVEPPEGVSGAVSWYAAAYDGSGRMLGLERPASGGTAVTLLGGIRPGDARDLTLRLFALDGNGAPAGPAGVFPAAVSGSR